MKIALFPAYGSLNSRPIFSALIQHLKDKKEDVQIDTYDETTDVAVIWSVLWRGRMQGNQKIYNHFRKMNKPVVVLEVGGIIRNKTWKIAINGINADADFANHVFDDTRWPKFRINLKPWKQKGDNILVLGQHDHSQQWHGLPKMQKWLEQQVAKIREYTDRTIIVRPHPRNIVPVNVNDLKNVKIKLAKRDNNTYDDTDFQQTLRDSWAVVNHSSNPAMQSVFNGVPVFVSKSSLSKAVGNLDVSAIEKPAMPDRQEWANKLSYTEWYEEEIKEGLPWKRIRNRLEEKYL